MATDTLLHVASPSKCNTQQNTVFGATACATGVQQPSLKALSGAVLARNKPCNSNATPFQKACNNDATSSFSPVASPGNSELDGLIAVVADDYECSADERQQMSETAGRKIEAALTSFRLLALRACLPHEPILDDRIKCIACRNLDWRGRCLCAQRGEMANTYSGYSPVTDVLRRCAHFKRKSN